MPPSIPHLKYFVANQWLVSHSEKTLTLYNPSTGQQIATAPCCSEEEINSAVKAAKDAFPSWSETPVSKRVQVLFKFKALVETNLEALATLLSTEMGKTHAEAVGEYERGLEIVEYACGIPSHLMGEALGNVSKDIDVVTYRVPIGICVGIVPFNFPAMIPLWMFPIAIACGNTFVLKAANQVPQSAMKLMELLVEAGMPPGVVNLVTCENDQAEHLLRHPDVKVVSFVGSTRVAQRVYETAAREGKRVQALAQAKNHALVLPDCALERTVKVIINAAFGCGGQRCMALPVVVVHNAIADSLIELVLRFASEIRMGDANDPETQLGPLVTAAHKQRVLEYIEKGEKEGARLILDGRNLLPVGAHGCAPLQSHEPSFRHSPCGEAQSAHRISESGNPLGSGFYLGPTVFDHVTNDMVIGREEIFGPVLCFKRVDSFKEGLEVINASEFGNGAAVFTQSGYHAREFTRQVQAGMVGVNVAIPVPIGYFSFTGWKKSFFGDLHSHGKDGVLFYTEKKSVTYRWFDEESARATRVGTWD